MILHYIKTAVFFTFISFNLFSQTLYTATQFGRSIFARIVNSEPEVNIRYTKIHPEWNLALIDLDSNKKISGTDIVSLSKDDVFLEENNRRNSSKIAEVQHININDTTYLFQIIDAVNFQFSLTPLHDANIKISDLTTSTKLEDFSFGAKKLSDYLLRHDYVLIDFCQELHGPSVRNIPLLHQLNPNVKVIGWMNPDLTTAQLEKLKHKYSINYECQPFNPALSHLFNQFGNPFYVLIDKNLNILAEDYNLKNIVSTFQLQSNP